jgi:hypothetical protein
MANEYKEPIAHLLRAYINGVFDMSLFGLSINSFSKDSFQELNPNDRLTGIAYEEVERETNKTLTSFRIIASKLLSISDQRIRDVIKPEFREKLERENAQFFVEFDENGQIKSATQKKDTDIAVESTDKLYEMIEQMKKILQEKGIVLFEDVTQLANMNLKGIQGASRDAEVQEP